MVVELRYDLPTVFSKVALQECSKFNAIVLSNLDVARHCLRMQFLKSERSCTLEGINETNTERVLLALRYEEVQDVPTIRIFPLSTTSPPAMASKERNYRFPLLH